MKGLFTNIKRIAIAASLIASSFGALQAQQSFGGIPASFEASQSELRSVLVPNIVRVDPDFNAEDLLVQNDWQNSLQMQTKPLMIGRIIDTHIDFAKEAKRMQLPDGRIIYRLNIQTKGAKAINLYYKDFFIPEGAGALFIYTPDRSTLLGSYNHDTHKEHGAFATEPLPGSSVILEYECAIGKESVMPSIVIEGINYIFRNIPQFAETRETTDPGEDFSNADCTVNVNCPDGDMWQVEKTGVAQILLRIGSATALCTGNLLNNTNEDFTPYILSAGHCLSPNDVLPTSGREVPQLDQFVFSFHYEKPGCSSAAFALNNIKTMVGCNLRAFLPIKGQSDGALMELKSKIPEAYRVYYNGWDRSPAVPSKVVGIHHPAGDAKKVSVNNGGIDITVWHGQVIGGDSDHFRFHFANRSNTEGGSSGSSLWDADSHLVVGTLSGGLSGCEGDNLYGRLNSHWDKYSSTPDYPNGVKSHMDIFLDPKTNGKAMQLKGTWRNGHSTLRAVPEIDVAYDSNEKKLNVSWKPVPKDSYPSHWEVVYRIYRNGQYIANVENGATTFSESVTDAKADFRTSGSVYYGVQVRYKFGGDKIPDDGYNQGRDYIFGDSDIVTQGVYIDDLIYTMPAKVTQQGTGVNVVWKAPGNMQELSCFGYPSQPDYSESFTFPQAQYIDDSGFAVGTRATGLTKFHVEGLDAKSSAYIYAISFIPLAKPEANDKFRIVVRNGGDSGKDIYEEVFEDFPDDWKKGQWVTAELKKPFKINPMKMTLAGYSTKNRRNNHHGYAIVVNSEDKEMRYRDGLISGDNGRSFFPTYMYGITTKKGYTALRLLLSPSSQKYTDSKEYKVISRSKAAIPFPRVKGYRLLRDGKEIVPLMELNFYNDPDGNVNSKYTVEVIYDNFSNNDAKIIEQVAAPGVYPTHASADGMINISHSDQVLRLTLYTIDGRIVKTIENPGAQVSVADLAEGSYLVVLETVSNKISQYITK